MALTSALGAAASGLSATARRIETVANNVANAATEGYARREVQLTSNRSAPGVAIAGVTRQIDPFTLAERRGAGAEAARTGLLADQILRIEQAFGTAEEEGSLQAGLDRLDSALLAAAGDPDADSRLAAVADAATAVADRFAAISDTIQQVRGEVDRRIGSSIDQLNADLAGILRLDRQIAVALATGGDAASMQDARQQRIDGVATLIPLREYPRPNGQTALIAVGGAVLLDGKPAVFGFSPAALVSASSTAPLSGLTLNGRPLGTGPGSLIDGGELAAGFDLRDRIAPEAQAGLDSLALSLARRLADADPTLAPGAAGLLTDGGAAAQAATAAGLSARLALNPTADPDAGGALAALRDGLAATTPRSLGDGSVLSALAAALSARMPRSLAGEAAVFLDSLSTDRLAAETEASAAAARRSTLAEAAGPDSVNTDREMQDLLQIEQAYAANAKVIATVDALLKTLMEV